MSQLVALLDHYRSLSQSEREKGTYFERFIPTLKHSVKTNSITRYPLNIFLHVFTASLKTNCIVKALPALIVLLWTGVAHSVTHKSAELNDTSGIAKDLLFVLSPNVGLQFGAGNPVIAGGVGSVYYFPVGIGIGGLTDFNSYQLEALAKLHLGMFGYSIGAVYSPEKQIDGLWDVWLSFFAITGIRYRKVMGDEGAHAIQIFCPLMFWNQWVFGQVPKRMNYIR